MADKNEGDGLPLGPTIVLDKNGKVVGKMTNKDRENARKGIASAPKKSGVVSNES